MPPDVDFLISKFQFRKCVSGNGFILADSSIRYKRARAFENLEESKEGKRVQIVFVKASSDFGIKNEK